MMNVQDGPVAVSGGVVPHCLAMKRAFEEILEPDVLLPQHAGARRRYVVGGLRRRSGDVRRTRA